MIDQTETEQIVLSDQDVIDFESAIPFYYQLQAPHSRKNQIGRVESGQKLPSEIVYVIISMFLAR